MNIRTMFRVLSLIVLLSASALADTITINFVSSLITLQPGQTGTFFANLINTTGETVYLNGDTLNIPAPLTWNDTFLSFSPATLAQHASSGNFQIFDIGILPGTPFGLYIGSIDIFGGASPNDYDPLGSKDWAVNVVPEPAYGSLLLLALCAGGFAKRILSPHPHVTRDPLQSS